MEAASSFPLGISDFETLISQGALYVDKTTLIECLEQEESEILIFPRPRRFGKSLNFSMLHAFYELRPKSAAELFQGLAIEKSPSFARQGSLPVIHLSFGQLVHSCWSDCLGHMRLLFRREYERHVQLLQQLHSDGEPQLQDIKLYFEPGAELGTFLKELGEGLSQWYDQKVLILIDDYDMPITHAQRLGYGNYLIDFLRNLFANLREAGWIDRILLSGTMRIGKDLIFPDKCGLFVSDYQDSKYAPYFGLTEDEVLAILRRHQLEERLAEVREWYDGYRFGAESIYSPWSVLLFLKERRLRSHWVEAASLKQAGSLVETAVESRPETFPLLLELFQGGSPEILVGNDTTQGPFNTDGLLDLLASSGYLAVWSRESGNQRFQMRLANQGIRVLAQRLTQVWTGSAWESTHSEWLLRLLAEERVDELSEWLTRAHECGRSFIHSGMQPDIHVFMLGIATLLTSHYQVHAEFDLGRTRFALQIEPKDRSLPAYLWVVQPWKPSGLAMERAWVIQRVFEEALQQPYWNECREQMSRRGYPNAIMAAMLISDKKLWLSGFAGTRELNPQGINRGKWKVYQSGNKNREFDSGQEQTKAIVDSQRNRTAHERPLWKGYLHVSDLLDEAEEKKATPSEFELRFGTEALDAAGLKPGWTEVLICHDALRDLQAEYDEGEAYNYLEAMIGQLQSKASDRLEDSFALRKLRRMLDNALDTGHLLGKKVVAGTAVSEILVELIRTYNKMANRYGFIPIE